MTQRTRKIIAICFILTSTALLSLLPDAKLETFTHSSYNYYSDLAQHSLYYLFLSLITSWIFHSTSPWKLGLWLFGLSLLLEISQHFSPRRSFSIHDIMSNFTGILVGVAIVSAFRYFRRIDKVPQG
ncbi:MAG: VanZ family protein [Chitinophagaceae bacterium]